MCSGYFFIYLIHNASNQISFKKSILYRKTRQDNYIVKDFPVDMFDRGFALYCLQNVKHQNVLLYFDVLLGLSMLSDNIYFDLFTTGLLLKCRTCLMNHKVHKCFLDDRNTYFSSAMIHVLPSIVVCCSSV